MCIKDVRQELNTLLHTQDLDGLLHLYKCHEKRAAPCYCACYVPRLDG
jgi:hypothetical protein